MKIIGLIPARKGSKRIPRKNMALLNGKPLIQYAIETALESKIFNEIVVSTNWDQCADFVSSFKIKILKTPPGPIHTDLSHDYQWVSHALKNFPGYDIFVILRPTSPFRTTRTIQRALKIFVSSPACDSLRAIEPTKSHPGKSWSLNFWDFMEPFENIFIAGFPSYDLATQQLETIYVQNGCIHIAWTHTLNIFQNVSGERIKGFLTEGNEGIDINTPEDLEYAQWIMRGKP